MEQSTVWWLLVGGLIVAELLTGTFYLLMLALGAVAGALTAHMGGSEEWQVWVAAGIGGGATAAWHLLRPGRQRESGANANTNLHLDIGEAVHIAQWNSDGTADVQYRGARWTAIHRTGVIPSAGAHRVAEIVGNRLLVDKA